MGKDAHAQIEMPNGERFLYRISPEKLQDGWRAHVTATCGGKECGFCVSGEPTARQAVISAKNVLVNTHIMFRQFTWDPGRTELPALSRPPA